MFNNTRMDAEFCANIARIADSLDDKRTTGNLSDYELIERLEVILKQLRGYSQNDYIELFDICKDVEDTNEVTETFRLIGNMHGINNCKQGLTLTIPDGMTAGETFRIIQDALTEAIMSSEEYIRACLPTDDDDQEALEENKKGLADQQKVYRNLEMI